MVLSKVAPLAWNAPIVDEHGNPTPYFQRQLAQLLGEKAATDALAEAAVPGTRLVSAGTGLTGGGALTSDITLNVDTTAEAERIRDIIGTALVAGTNITITVNDAGDTITIASSGGGGGGSETLLSTQTISASASPVVFNNTLITSSYKMYRIRWFNTYSSAGGGLLVQPSPDNGTTWRSTFTYTRTIWQIDGTFSAKSAGATNGYMLNADVQIDSTVPCVGECVIYDPMNPSSKKFAHARGVAKFGDGHRYDYIAASEYVTAEAHNALRILISTGNLTGTFKLYGIS